MILSLIAAMSEDRVIGRDGGLPWRLPADLARFKRITLGKPVIMGRRTYESIGRPLPGRTNLVLSRRCQYGPPGVLLARSLDEALSRCDEAPEVFVIGGELLFREALPRADRIYLTRVAGTVEGDRVFPELDLTAWRVVAEEPRVADAKNPRAMVFLIYERVSSDLPSA